MTHVKEGKGPREIQEYLQIAGLQTPASSHLMAGAGIEPPRNDRRRTDSNGARRLHGDNANPIFVDDEEEDCEYILFKPSSFEMTRTGIC
ncbi:hypothetical protein V7S43_003577 [Phytophthora oleae]|uniref:Uncharacterized protein n=1 Tax=Phytophthora oleae TaxID=2107226 RepID=A0ABD3G0T7_9STRA